MNWIEPETGALLYLLKVLGLQFYIAGNTIFTNKNTYNTCLHYDGKWIMVTGFPSVKGEI